MAVVAQGERLHIERVHFDEVFDVEAGRGDFSFRSGGRAEYGVNLARGVVPHPGSTFALAFAEAGNWATVLGWRDLASAEVALRHGNGMLVLAALGDLGLYGPFFVALGLLFGGIWPGLALGAAFFVAFSAALVYKLVRDLRGNRAVRRALLAADTGESRDNPGAQHPARCDS